MPEMMEFSQASDPSTWELIDGTKTIMKVGEPLTPEAYKFVLYLMEECADKQARIDALMLEYCPDEMTPEQVEVWKRHQAAKTEFR